ncbi:putative NADPH-quinone reductase [Sphingomonas vulcanisoli]|uniref:NADPH-quinone reductase n=1 Tax=Sphingomonas vulcanisoli TaxID=1658060 RepID=A0ABX0TWD1_9SPHN|nr:putative NADPH-quinone reductase [Sphingomonas vulcanisoli]
MTLRRIAIIDGHPDPDPARFVHALADRYAEGATKASHEVRRIMVSALEFSLLGSRHDWEGEYIDFDIKRSQVSIRWADHLVFLYPLWLGDMPALLKGFLEQVMRPGFAFEPQTGKGPQKALKGRSALVVVTMGMPALVYRAYYGAHSVKSLERNILKFSGISPVQHMIIGDVEARPGMRDEWLSRLSFLGETGQ